MTDENSINQFNQKLTLRIQSRNLKIKINSQSNEGATLPSTCRLNDDNEPLSARNSHPHKESLLKSTQRSSVKLEKNTKRSTNNIDISSLNKFRTQFLSEQISPKNEKNATTARFSPTSGENPKINYKNPGVRISGLSSISTNSQQNKVAKSLSNVTQNGDNEPSGKILEGTFFNSTVKEFRSALVHDPEFIRKSFLNRKANRDMIKRLFLRNKDERHDYLTERNLEIDLDDIDVSPTLKNYYLLTNNPAIGPEFIQKKFKPSFIRENSRKVSQNKFLKNNKTITSKSTLISKKMIQDPDTKYDKTTKTKFAQVSKLKMKWNTMKWLLDTKKDIIEKLLYQFSETGFMNRIKGKDGKKVLSKIEFSRLMMNFGITSDQDLINKLFWVFDEDGSGDLRYEELLFGCEMFRDSSAEDKLRAFFLLCDLDGSGAISKNEFFNLMGKNIIKLDEKQHLKKIIDKIFSSVQLNEEGEITFEALNQGCKLNKEIYNIIYKNLNELGSIDKVIDNDIKNEIFNFNEVIDKFIPYYFNMPLRESKFECLINGFIENKERKIINNLNLRSKRNHHDFNKVDDEEMFLDDQETLISLAVKNLKGKHQK